jgi:hypothetical protein
VDLYDCLAGGQQLLRGVEMGISLIPPSLNNGVLFNGPIAIGDSFAILETDGAGNTAWRSIRTLPTSDPGVAGRLWNSSGLMAISAGGVVTHYKADGTTWKADSSLITADAA